jgi:hypothetical protein
MGFDIVLIILSLSLSDGPPAAVWARHGQSPMLGHRPKLLNGNRRILRLLRNERFAGRKIAFMAAD